MFGVVREGKIFGSYVRLGGVSNSGSLVVSWVVSWFWNLLVFLKIDKEKLNDLLFFGKEIIDKGIVI